MAHAHADPVVFLALGLAIILVVAKLGGELAARLGQPPVLGELMAGMVLGNVGLLGVPALAELRDSAAVDVLGRLGAVLLLFEVGLESSVAQMKKVGGTAFVVATLGVIAPMALGWGACRWLLPDESVYVHVFIGATLCATSVGITARVFQDLGCAGTNEARVILGAAVIDDVLGLIVLAVVSGIIGAAGHGGGVPWADLGFVVLKAGGFLVGALLVGTYVSPWLFQRAARLRSKGTLLAVSLSFCFALAWLSGVIGLAPIVGAFAAGLVLEEAHTSAFVARGEARLESLVRPLTSFLVPVFFVLMGMRTDLTALFAPGVPLLALALTVAAIAGKQVCGLGARRGMDRLFVGIGMIPRGEVGLIVAAGGASMTVAGKPLISGATFSAVVVTVMATTLVTPPALRWARRRQSVSAVATVRASRRAL